MTTKDDFYKVDLVWDQYDNSYRKVTINWDYIWSIPEFAALKTTRQSPKWHSEGEFVSIHVEKVVEYMVDFVEHNLTEYGNVMDFKVDLLLLSAIFHDIGKCRTTFFKESDQLWHHYGHEIEGEKITRRILWDLPIDLREGVCSLVRWHMEPLNIVRSKDCIQKVLDMSTKVPSMSLLYWLKVCDIRGSVSEDPSLNESDELLLSNIMLVASELDCFTKRNNSFDVVRKIQHKISKKPKLNVDLYIGLPGSGKDTAIHNDPRFSDKVVICRDDIRAYIGLCGEGEKYLGTEDEENLVTKIFNEKLLKAANEGKYIVLNNMNNRRKYRDGYKKLLSGYDVTWRYIMCEARGIEKNIERRKGQIPSIAFTSMIERMEWPTPDEYDRLEFMLS